MVATVGEDEVPSRIERHGLVGRLYHWSMAAAVLVLLATAFLPIVGIRFEWLQIHWMTGVLLTLLVGHHIILSISRRDPRDMWLGLAEIRGLLGLIRAELTGQPFRFHAGKYSPAQKIFHASSALPVLAVIITGGLMLLKIDTPWWERDPYLLPQHIWGYVYVVHGLASLGLITLIMVHAYIAVRPEKRVYTRSMILGWITPAEWHYHQTAEQDVKQDQGTGDY